MSRADRKLVRPRLTVLALVATWTVAGTPLLSADLPSGYRPTAFAIQGARVVASPGTTLDAGTVVVRDGIIEAVGPADKVAIPYDAEVIDGKGLVVYPGFIDPYTTVGQAAGASRSRTGPGRPVDASDSALARTPPDNRHGLTPEFEVASALELGDSLSEERRKLGFTDLLSAPVGAIATGQSALVSTSGLPRREAIVLAPVALHVNVRAPFEPAQPKDHDDEDTAPRARGPQVDSRYPTTTMGAVAHLRQAMLDAEHEDRLQAEKGAARPAFDPALRALHAARTRALPVWWEANTRDEIHRALDLAEEFGTSAVIVGGREASKVADRLKAKDVAVVLRIDFPDEPRVPSEADYRKRDPADREVPLKALAERAARWKERVATARELARAGVRFALSSDGIAKAENVPSQWRKLIAAGLPADAALDALTRRPAEIAGVDRRLGTIEPGKLGHLVVMSAPFGDESAKVRYVLVDGLKFDYQRPAAPARSDDASNGKKAEAKPEPGFARSKAEDTPKDAPRADPAPTKPEAVQARPESPQPKADAPRTIEDQPPQTPFVDVATEFDESRKPRLRTGGNVLIKDATVLTGGKDGTLARGSILVRDGKVAAVGPDVAAPDGVAVIDAAGMVAIPGIIDTHSHIAIQGGVNEWSLSITPEVRVKDVVDGDDPSIYRALAGGVTAARLLHGSANTIGGQDAVIKLKHGLAGRDLILRDAPQGVKFALGENVTRRPGRFPNSRMGVEATIERAFEEARAYQAARKAFDTASAEGKAPSSFRRDLRLEALAGVLDGSIKIHCHCYILSEILMLLRVAERNGVRVRSLQHVLEGYKVAAEIAAHGASASTFSDWWNYKYEAADAIPFNASLMTRAGVSVCIKSDSEELIRHLYLEAAKMVKYGGMTEAQALAMITLNPARELGLDARLGSIEVGKDADVALFNAHPFDGFARCELTLIDGEVWFQRAGKEGKFSPRPGDHAAMPGPPAAVRGRPLEIAPNDRGVYALVGATIHPVAGAEIANGTLVVAGGKIAAIGGEGTPIPAQAQTVDAHGLDVWPGLVDAGTRLGLYEVGSLAETHDDADSARFQPELPRELGAAARQRADPRDPRQWHPDGLRPADRRRDLGAGLPDRPRRLGPPGDGPGRPRGAECLDAAPRPAGPRRLPLAGGDGPDPRQRRREQIEAIKEQFRRALAYDKVQAEAAAHQAAPPAPDPRLSALVPYARGQRPVIFRADHRNEILDALKLAEDLKLKAIITGGAEAWKVADALKAADVPVLVAGTLQLPSDPADPYDAPFSNPARLFEAGVTFAIRSNGQGPEQPTSARNLPYEAATAVAFGLPEAEAVKAVTLTPARVLGIADRVGSLEVGKRANIVVTAGHILRPTTEVKALFLDGKPLPPESKHTELYARYLRRLSDIQAGTAHLGLDPRPAPSSAPPAGPTPDPPAAPASGR